MKLQAIRAFADSCQQLKKPESIHIWMVDKLKTDKTKKQSEYLHRRCPTCAGHEIESGTAISSTRTAESMAFDEIGANWQQFFKSKMFFTYRRCSHCAQLFCPIFFSQDQLVRLYSGMSDNTANLPVDVVAKTQHRYFHLMKEFNATEGNYLEFGPDIGLLTEACARNGTFDKAYLIEPNLEVHSELSARCGDMTHEIFAEMDAYRNIPDASLNVITMIHVLDHLLEPHEILRALKKKLKPEGKIVIVTHDESSLLARILGVAWPPYCLQHPQLYSPKSSRHLLTNAGFTVLGIRKTYNYFPVTYLLKHFLWAVRLGNFKLPNWYAFNLPLKLGNIATIAKV